MHSHLFSARILDRTTYFNSKAICFFYFSATTIGIQGKIRPTDEIMQMCNYLCSLIIILLLCGQDIRSFDSL